MANKIKDLVYANRWVDVNGFTVKFENQLAEVPDECLSHFENDKDFVILERTPEVPLKKLKKK